MSDLSTTVNRCTIVRPGDVYGPRSRPWTTRPVRLIQAGSLVLPLQGKGIFSPVYIDNLIVRENFTSLLAAKALVADRLRKKLGAESQWNETGVRYLCRRGTYAIEKARTLLGFEPQVDLDEGMRRTEEWLRKEGFI